MQTSLGDATRWRIYIAEDDEDDLYFITGAMASLDYEIELCSFCNGKDLITEIVEEGARLPDLIILDLNLPLLDGKQALKKIKSLPETEQIPVIIYTTSRSEEDMQDVYQLGANSYVVKPSSVEDIHSTIRHICDYWFRTAPSTTYTRSN